ncbi:hypothetical protein D3C87_1303890 [compost metagenome]
MQGDAEVDDQERVHHAHGLGPASGGNLSGDGGAHALECHRRCPLLIGVDIRRPRSAARSADEGVGCRWHVYGIARRVGQLQGGGGGQSGHLVGVVGHVADGRGDVFGTGNLANGARAEIGAGALGHR